MSSSTPSASTAAGQRPLTRESVIAAHELIKPHVHETPVLTNQTLNHLCSIPRSNSKSTAPAAAAPKINLFLKCENFQKVGAFKYRGATHALLHLLAGTSALPGTHGSVSAGAVGSENGSSTSTAQSDRTTLLRTHGVITHSSGNHAQALALAARTLGIPATIVMPRISTPSKIAATQGYGARVIFSGSTSAERESVVQNLMREDPHLILVPPYDATDIILGQGTMGLEFATQVQDMVKRDLDIHSSHSDASSREFLSVHGEKSTGELNAVIAPVGGGGMLSGVALSFAGSKTRVFGAEPLCEGADDCKRGLESQPPARIEHVSSLTIADGVRTPVGVLPWGVISDKTLVRGVYAVTEEQILMAMRLVWERVKIVVEPTAALGVAVALFDEDFREMVRTQAEREGRQGWDVGVIISGGNVDLSAAGALLARGATQWDILRGLGKVGLDGDASPVVEDVAG